MNFLLFLKVKRLDFKSVQSFLIQTASTSTVIQLIMFSNIIGLKFHFKNLDFL